MSFDEILDQVRELLRQRGRLSYGALKRRFDLDDTYVEDIKSELIKAECVAADENGEVLVWIGNNSLASSVQSLESQEQRQVPPAQTLDARPRTLDAVAERRQLTVMFCDLVGSTALSAQLDPEDYRTVVQQYQHISAEVIQRHEGYLAQYLGDGLLVYFGYPTAHEDDARRAVRTGLEIIEALRHEVLSPRQGEGRGEVRLPVRIGIHTGLVVIGEIGSTEKRELLALGETPNIAARLQSLAEPNTVIISAATQRLVERQFACQPFGSHLLKGIDTPIAVYYVQSERQSSSQLEGKTTLTPLIGREQEVGLLIDRWEQTKEGRGQIVLLSGEPGIGKSRLAYTLRERVTAEGSLLYEARCSPYHQHSAFYPLIDVLQRTLLLNRQNTDSEKVGKLERALALYNLQDSLPLFTALLSLPTPAQYPPLHLTPQKQKERTLQALIQLLIAQAERQATVSVWEDLHWADPSSLEFLSLLIEQIPTTKLLLVLTFRPEFTPPWKSRSHLAQLVLNRLGKKQVEVMIEKVAVDRALPAEVIEQIRVKTDGVPLFVEELTKSVVESVREQEVGNRDQKRKSVETFGIPTTLQEALLARLDRLSTARQVAQLGATLGREFSYELLQAVTPLSKIDLQAALNKLVEAEILYQRGVGEQARYFFKHALIQDTAYQSLLKSTRQQYHKQIAQVLEEQFPQTKETQPELLAHHYTEAGLIEQAIPYWQKAGERATQRSAYTEAISHLTVGLELIKTLPDTSKRAQQELMLQVTLGTTLMATQGYAAPEVGKVYARARELCRQVNETPHLFSVLWGLTTFYGVRGELQTAQELVKHFVGLAQNVRDTVLRTAVLHASGAVSVLLGEFTRAREHLEQGISLYDPHQHRSYITFFGEDLSVSCLCWGALALFSLGYPDQALKRTHEALLLAQDLSHPTSLGYALTSAAHVHRNRREESATQGRAEALLSLGTEHGFTLRKAMGTIYKGWALAMQGQGEEGIALLRQGLAAFRATGAEFWRPGYLALLAEALGKVGQIKKGLAIVSEALDVVGKTDERFYEAELYRLRGELTLQQFRVQGSKFKVENSPEFENPNAQHPTPNTHAKTEAEECFHRALEVARRQQAKSWELRASTSLARLWQQQGKKAEAHKLLSEVYNWFTEGFDTKDLQEAKALIDSLEPIPKPPPARASGFPRSRE